MSQQISKHLTFGHNEKEIDNLKKLKEYNSPERTKIINDPLHGHIDFSKDLMSIIDTQEFQRLRDLKQLGALYYVFPGASHNRFEHCLGVSHLSRKWINLISDNQKHLEIRGREKHLIEVAGLCHDLGHGPFSHVFDSKFIPKALGTESKWTHEDASVMMLKYMVEENGLDYDKYDLQFLENLIHGKCPNSQKERKYLYHIVSNQDNSVDVDKFDYLQRDCHNLNLKTSYDSARLMKFSKVIDDSICFHAKEAYNLYEMFHTRYSLHKQIYSHKASKSISYMITDALFEADKFLKISDSIHQPERYSLLTDCIVKEIERSDAKELKTSREILKRIRKRELYKFVDEIPLFDIKMNKQLFTIDDILEHQDGNDLTCDDLILDDAKFNYAMKDKNPVDSVYFYNKGSDDKFHISKDEISLLIPDQFQERFIGCYVKDSSKLEIARNAFQKWAKSLHIKSSPYKKHFK
eukprot:gene973-9880_t